jgi:hypothetical protein
MRLNSFLMSTIYKLALRLRSVTLKANRKRVKWAAKFARAEPFDKLRTGYAAEAAKSKYEHRSDQ